MDSNKQLEKVERLVPKLCKRIGWSLKVIPTQNYNFNALAREALWLATCESKHEKIILQKASSLMIEWLREDTEPEIKENLRLKRNKRHPRPTNDPFSLPWGARMSATTINSGLKGPLDVAIDPNETDTQLLESDSSQYLLKIFGHVLEWWGPQTLVWFVLCMSGIGYKEIMTKLGDHKNESGIKHAMRIISRVKQDIQSNFTP